MHLVAWHYLKSERDGDSSTGLGLSPSKGMNEVGVWAHYCYKHAQYFTRGSNKGNAGGGPVVSPAPPC